MATRSKNKFTFGFAFLMMRLSLPAQNVEGTDGFFDKIKTVDFYTAYNATIEFKLQENKLVYDYALEKTACYPGEKATHSGPQSISYSDYYTNKVKLSAYMLRRTNSGKYRREKIKEFYSRTVPSEGIFYEDQIEQYFLLPAFKPGDCSQFKSSYRGIDPLLSSRFIFNLEMPIKTLHYQIVIPNNVHMRFVFIGDSTGISHTVKNEKNKAIHSFYAENRSAIAFEENAEDIAYYTPHLFVVPVSYTVNGQETRLAGTVKNLFDYYNSQIKKIDSSNNTDIHNISLKITEGLQDTLGKIKATYDWVQKNIKYVAFEEGPGGFIPRPADKILHNKYGDCKDKANLLIDMLNSLGIPAYYTWVGTRSKPYTYNQLPSPHVDNHMICSVKIKGLWYYLDATALALEYQHPSAFIQGKEAFIRLNDSAYALEKIPEVPSAENYKIDSLFVSIDQDNISGRGVQKNAGYFKENCSNTIINQVNHKKQLMQSIELGNNKLSLTDFKINNGGDDLHFEYHFKLPDYLQQFNDEWYLNMNLIKDLESKHVNTEKRKHGVSNEFKYELRQHINLVLPADKTVALLPPNSKFQNEQFSFEITYSHVNDHIIYDKKIRMNHLLLQRDNFKDWNDMMDQLNKAYSEVVQIKSK